MNNYYTPEVGDLFVGYECEKQILDFSCMGNCDHLGWEPYKIGQDGDWDKGLREMKSYIFWSSRYLRTSYLTKDQIVGEGWVHKEGCLYIKGDEKGHHFYAKYPYTTLKPNPLIIMEFTPSDREDPWSMCCTECRFNGECPSINEFRYISKLLRI